MKPDAFTSNSNFLSLLSVLAENKFYVLKKVDDKNLIEKYWSSLTTSTDIELIRKLADSINNIVYLKGDICKHKLLIPYFLRSMSLTRRELHHNTAIEFFSLSAFYNFSAWPQAERESIIQNIQQQYRYELNRISQNDAISCADKRDNASLLGILDYFMRTRFYFDVLWVFDFLEKACMNNTYTASVLASELHVLGQMGLLRNPQKVWKCDETTLKSIKKKLCSARFEIIFNEAALNKYDNLSINESFHNGLKFFTLLREQWHVK